MKGFKVSKIDVKLREACAVTALIQAKSGTVYVGLTAYLNALALIDPKTDKVTDPGPVFPETKNRVHVLDKIHNSIVEDKDGMIYFGRGINLDHNGVGGTVTGTADAAMGMFDMGAYEGGRIYSYDEKMKKITDLGLMMPHNGVHSICIDPDRKIIYGYGIPDNHFYSFNTKTGEAKDYGKISTYCSHNHVCAKNGNVYGGWMHGDGSVHLFKYDVKKDELFRLPQLLVYHIGKDIAGNVGMDSFYADDNGDVYASTVDGLLLKINSETDEVSILGKPLLTPRMTRMTKGPDGKLYISAGYPVMSLITFDPKTGKFEDFGQPETSHPMCYYHGIAVTKEGNVYLGETDGGRSIVYKLTR